MSESIHTVAQFNDKDAAREHLEPIYWPNCPVCQHCGGAEHTSRLSGSGYRPGPHFCSEKRSALVPNVNGKTLHPLLAKHISPEAHSMTDELKRERKKP